MYTPVCNPLSKTHHFRQKNISYKNALKCNGELYYTCVSKKICTFESLWYIAQTNKNRHHWLPCSSYGVWKSLFGVRRITETKVRGNYLQYGRNETFYHDFFVETDFFFWLHWWILRQSYSLICLPNCYCTNEDISSSNCLMLQLQGYSS